MLNYWHLIAVMNFYCITDDRNPTTNKLLFEACQKRNINFVKIVGKEYDMSLSVDLGTNDLLYRVGTRQESIIVEKLLLNLKCVSLYDDYLTGVKKPVNVIESSILHLKAHIPIPKTIFALTNNRKLLLKYVEQLDGFPLIIKAAGGSHGVGVIKVDSAETLFSLADYLLVHDNNDFILREYIDYVHHARLIVLGNKVIDSIEYKRVRGDFRSNVGHELEVNKKKFTDVIEESAVKAVHSLGWEFGGVDVLIDKNGNHYLIEVNMPCFFPRCQMITGTDIAGMMIGYLLEKAKSWSK